MAFPQSGFPNKAPERFEKESEEKPFTPEERLNLVKKYLTLEGKELFAELCLKYFKPIVGRMIDNHYSNEDVEDVVQVAAFKAAHSLGQFTGEATLTTWLFKIGTNEVYDFLRKKRQNEGIFHAQNP